MRGFYVAMICFFLCGAAWGLHETLMHHYSAFEKVFPAADAGYWNPAVSWKRKYAAGNQAQGAAFPGSRTVLVFLTDAKHLVGEVWRDLLFWGAYEMFLWHRRRKYRYHFLFLVFIWMVWRVCHAVGFHLIYTFLFNI